MLSKFLLRGYPPVVDSIAKSVGSRQRDIHEPYPAARLVALQLRVVVVQISQNGRDNHRHTLSIRSRPNLQVYTKCLLCKLVSN